MNKKVYFENLDGLRFICFLSVFFLHSFRTEFETIKSNTTYQFIVKDIFGNGSLGVNSFFVLSGFLITYLLIEEKRTNGQINLKRFWIRRILRIWPLFYLCVFIGFFIYPEIKSLYGQHQPTETASIFYYLTFLNNFDIIHNGIIPDASILGVLWSVAIEEQFYLIWPIILYILPIKRYWIAFSSVLIISLLFGIVNEGYMLNKFHTLTCMGDLAVGAFGAWFIATNENFKMYIQHLSVFKIAFVYLLLIIFFLFRDEIFTNCSSTLTIFERPIFAFIILLVILEQSFSEHSLFKLSTFRLLTKLGTISYGLYCLHFFGILIVTILTNKFLFNKEVWQVLVFETFLSLSLSIFISWLSYWIYEKPFLRMKERYSISANS